MIAARSDADTSYRASVARGLGGKGFKAAGLAFAAILPALFWMLVCAVAAPLMGYAVAPAALLALGCTIALFLTAVCAPIMLRS